jgi:hypothetical protein
MRGLVVRAVLLAVGIAALAAPGAAAEQYEFRASDGTSCTLTLTHATPQNADGTYDVSWHTGVRCNTELGSILVMSSLAAPPDRHWYTSSPYAYCTYGRIRCIYADEWAVDGTAPGVEADVFTQSGFVQLGLLSPTAVWLVVPVAPTGTASPLDCTPGRRDVTCQVFESFKPE